MEIEKNVLLKDKSWFLTGGPARFFCRPTTEDEFQEALIFAKKSNLSVELLGEGANSLISDEGYDGLIISPAIKKITQDGTLVTFGSGCSIQESIDWALDHNLVGIEEFSGIPGTIGGAVYINIHYFISSISQFLVGARVISKDGEVLSVDKSWFNFGYDHSKLQEKEWFLVSATLALKPATDLEIAYAKGRRDETIRHRNSRYPTARTCGSFFRNFHEHELVNVINGKKLKFVAYYLDKLGIKGELCHGNAVVSHQHANMLITQKDATASDVIGLAKKMQELVFKNFGIIPQSECQFIGFKSYPLHTEKTLF